MLEVSPDKYIRPRKSISKSLILKQQQTEANEPTGSNTGKAKEHFQQLRSKLKAIPKVAPPPVEQPKIQQNQQTKRRAQRAKQFKQQKANFQLEVSDTSSSQSFSSEDSLNVEVKQEVVQAKETLRKLSRQPHNYKNTSSFTNSPLQTYGESQQIIQQKPQIIQEKFSVDFIKSLEHNLNTNEIEEYYENGFLNIKIESDDMYKFLRYQNEVQEMLKRVQIYEENKGLHDILHDEIENYQQTQEALKQEKIEKQKEFVQQILLQEQQRQNLINQRKTKKIGDIAKNFIDRHPYQLDPKTYQRKQ